MQSAVVTRFCRPGLDGFGEARQFMYQSLLSIQSEREQPAALHVEHQRDGFVDDGLAGSGELDAERAAIVLFGKTGQVVLRFKLVETAGQPGVAEQKRLC